MISIDNAVELMMQTYISLPKRVTGIEISRKDRDTYCQNFPSLLDGIEEHAPERIIGLNLGEIEWFHRLRNELYHQGNGLTVELAKVEAYSELAEKLFESLFGVKLQLPSSESGERLGQFLSAWIRIERAVAGQNALRIGRVNEHANELLMKDPYSQPEDLAELSKLRTLRNRLVHGDADPVQSISDDVLLKVESFASKFEKLSK